MPAYIRVPTRRHLQAALKQLTGNCCHGITSVTIQLPQTAPLESVSLTGCRKLKQVHISAPWLTELAVDDCPQLNSLELFSCPSLTVLSASKCSHLGGVTPLLDCPKLQQLNLFGCRLLQSEGGRTPLPASMCVSLSVRVCVRACVHAYVRVCVCVWGCCSGRQYICLFVMLMAYRTSLLPCCTCCLDYCRPIYR